MRKDPVGAGTFCPLPILIFYIPPCWKCLPAWRNVKKTAWARDNMFLAHAGILHSSMPEISEGGFMFYILFPHTPGNCGLGV